MSYHVQDEGIGAVTVPVHLVSEDRKGTPVPEGTDDVSTGVRTSDGTGPMGVRGEPWGVGILVGSVSGTTNVVPLLHTLVPTYSELKFRSEMMDDCFGKSYKRMKLNHNSRHLVPVLEPSVPLLINPSVYNLRNHGL